MAAPYRTGAPAASGLSGSFDDDDDETGSKPTRTDTRRIVTGMRQNDAGARDSYAAQMRSEGTDPDTGAPLEATSSSRPSSSASNGGPVARLRRARLGSGVATGGRATAGLVSGKAPPSLAAGLLGVIGYAVLVNYLHGGWPQVKGWLGAKFANTPYANATSSAAGGATIIPFPTPAGASPAPTASATASAATSAVAPPGTLA